MVRHERASGEAAFSGAVDVVDGVRRFDFPAMSRVLYGPRSSAELGAEIARLGGTRALLVTTPSTARCNSAVEQLIRDLGALVVGVFSGAQAHVPASAVREATRAARLARADLIISIGGGSAIDCGKAVALCAPGEEDPVERLRRLAIRGQVDSFEVPVVEVDPLPHIAVSTTLSGAEFTPTFTVTNEATRAKEMVHDARLTPVVAILDATVASQTPSWLWAASGVRAIDHCVEWYLSKARTPFTDALCLPALRSLYENLPLSVQGSEGVAARQQCQVAAWMSVYGSSNVLGGLSHAIGHQLGSHCGMPHGFTSCIVLPHVIRFNSAVAASRVADLAAMFGLTAGTTQERAAAFVDELVALIRRLGLPTSLSEAGAADADLDRIAEATMTEVAIVNNPRPVAVSDIREILERAR